MKTKNISGTGIVGNKIVVNVVDMVMVMNKIEGVIVFLLGLSWCGVIVYHAFFTPGVLVIPSLGYAAIGVALMWAGRNIYKQLPGWDD